MTATVRHLAACLLLLAAIILWSPSPARADCADPVATAGKMIYNTDHAMAQYCDGTNWIAMGRDTTPATGPTDGIVGWWKLDETSGTTAADSSGSGNNGTLNGMDPATDWVYGKIEGALEFENSSQYIDVPGPVLGSQYTISLWYYLDSADTGFEGLVLDSGGYYGLYLYHDNQNQCGWNNKFAFDDGTVYCSGTSLTPDRWAHVAIVYNAGSVTFYVDGQPDGTTSKSWTPTIAYIGGSFAEYSQSKIDDVRIYNRTLSAAEVDAIYQAGLVVPSLASGLVGHWKLDETSGGSIADSSGNSNTGAWTDGDNNDVTEETVAGRNGTALDFNGTDDYVSVPHDASLDVSSGYTFAAWAWFDSTSANPKDPLISKNNTGGWGSRWIIYRTDSGGNIVDNKIRLAIIHNQLSGDNTAAYWTNWIFPVDQWVFVTVSWDGSDTDIYLNGKLIETKTGMTTPPGTASGTLLLGQGKENWAADAYLQGRMDAVYLYNRALSASEVELLYATSTPGKIIYNADDHVMQFSTDKAVHAMGPSTSSGCSVIGEVCPDGSIYAGDTNLYVTDVNQSTGIAYGGSAINAVDPDSLVDGWDNHANATIAMTSLPAMNACDTLDRHGHTDWYLPAIGELYTLYQNRVAIDANASESFVSTTYWSSSESSDFGSYTYNFAIDNYALGNKNNLYDVRCVRRSRCFSPEGREGQMFYNAADDVMQYCNGVGWVSIGK